MTNKIPCGEELIDAIVDAHKKGNKVLICGNGGLCAVSEHFAAELVGKFAFDVHIPCIALTSNTSLLTALANDFGFEELFAYQIRVLGKEGDILIAMTTSASRNIIRAVEAGNELGLTTVLICAPGSPGLGAKLTYRMECENEVAAVQDMIMEFLHHMAHDVKEKLCP